SRVVGFGGRALSKGQEPKYMNSPETVLYQKSNLLYGYCHTKSKIKEADQVLVVEGYMDFLSAFQNGVEHVVAVNGTALTLRQLSLLKSHTKNLILGFDMDSAGKEAAKRGYELSQEFDFVVKMLILKDGKDIAEFCLEHADELKNIIENTTNFTDYLYQDILSKYDLNSHQEKRKLIIEFADFWKLIKSSLEKEAYVSKLSLDLGFEKQIIIDEINNLKLSKNHPAKRNNDDKVNNIQRLTIYDKLLGLMLEFPNLFFDTKIDLGQGEIPESLKDVYKLLYHKYTSRDGDGSCDFSEVVEELEYEEQTRVKVLSLYAREHYGEMPEENVILEIKALYKLMLEKSKEEEKRRLHRSLMEAEKHGDIAKIQEILVKLNSLHQ
ncbi:toprim domain-containing protein, partial [Candidatus Peregrinibacteria bacterium]|nr:toprim domain-containing protein [Candidatus Peregrinibacteria bacterium]